MVENNSRKSNLYLLRPIVSERGQNGRSLSSADMLGSHSWYSTVATISGFKVDYHHVEKFAGYSSRRKIIIKFLFCQISQITMKERKRKVNLL